MGLLGEIFGKAVGVDCRGCRRTEVDCGAIRALGAGGARRAGGLSRWSPSQSKVDLLDPGEQSRTEVPGLEVGDHVLPLHPYDPGVGELALESVAGLHLETSGLHGKQDQQSIVSSAVSNSPVIKQLRGEHLGGVRRRLDRDDGNFVTKLGVELAELVFEQALFCLAELISCVADPTAVSCARIGNIGNGNCEEQWDEQESQHEDFSYVSPTDQRRTMSQLRNPTRLRAHLHQREDVPDEDIPELIALAEQLQDEADGEWGDVTPSELKQAAEELDIRPEFIDRAIDGLAARRQREQAEAKNRALRRKNMLRGLGAALLALCLGAGALGLTGASAVSSRHSQVLRAEAAVEVVIERQASLVPQLLALSGGDAATLDTAIQKVHAQDSIDAKLRASSELSAAMAQQLAQVEGTDSSVVQDLGYELTGTQNRISTETRRLRQAQSSHQQAASSLSGKMAVRLGLAPAP